MNPLTLHLAKQNFKFSAAHFLIFDENSAERLHGHNYQVKVDLVFASSRLMNEQGYLVDFNVFKRQIKARLDLWDERVLLPEQHQEMKFTTVQNSTTQVSLEVRFRDRFYVFPKDEVILLPVTNTSTEQLSRLLSEDFFASFKCLGVARVRVSVEETRGQGASTVCGE